MPDTGAPWNIPFLDGTELVRAYPSFSEDLADATAGGLNATKDGGNITSGTVAAARIANLDAGKITSGTFADARIPNLNASKITAGTFDQTRLPAGTIIAVKHAIKTNAQSSSVSGGGNVAVSGLSITHAVASASNQLIVMAYFGAAGNSSGEGNTGLAVMDGTTLIGVGNASGSLTRVGSGGVSGEPFFQTVIQTPSVTFVYTPGSGSKTYTVRAVNISGFTNTVYVNRTQRNTFNDPSSSSGLIIMEVKA